MCLGTMVSSVPPRSGSDCGFDLDTCCFTLYSDACLLGTIVYPLRLISALDDGDMSLA